MVRGRARLLLLALLFGSVLCQEQSDDLRKQDTIEQNTRICEEYLNTVGTAFDEGGVDGLTKAAYTLAVDNPVGPYIWCYKNITKDVRPGEIVRLLSPYLPSNTTLKDSTTVVDPSKFLTKIDSVAKQAIANCCGAPNYFNFSLPFNQNKSMIGSMYFDSERDFIGTSEKYPGTTDSYFFCGCPVRNVATTPRNNTYAELYLAGTPAVSACPLAIVSTFAVMLGLLMIIV